MKNLDSITILEQKNHIVSNFLEEGTERYLEKILVASNYSIEIDIEKIPLNNDGIWFHRLPKEVTDKC